MGTEGKEGGVIRIYVAGPYTATEVAEVESNVQKAIDAGEALAQCGYAALVPHLNRYWDLRHPHSYSHWMDWCLSWLAVADAVLRIPGNSPGAEREVDYAEKHNIPVFSSIESLRSYYESEP